MKGFVKLIAVVVTAAAFAVSCSKDKDSGAVSFDKPAVFIDAPTEEIISYAGGYLTAVAPFYVVLGLLIVYRSAVQSMGNSTAPFLACVVELVMRIGGALGLSRVLGYTGVCFSSPLAWIGATALLIPFYRREMRKGKNIAA